MTLVVRARAGQTLDQLEAGVPGLAATLDALSWRCTAYRGSTSTLLVELVMHDALRGPRDGTVPLAPTSAKPGHLLPLGRRDVGGTWGLTVAGRHTLVAGCSGSGKGSVLWGLVAGLAPLAPSETVRLWGIDLKHGVELRMEGRLFVGHRGNTLHRSNWTTVWAAARSAAELDPRVHLHDLRHTDNHFAAASGASTRELMHRMGHASMRAALIYQHATAEREARIAATLNQVFSGGAGR